MIKIIHSCDIKKILEFNMQQKDSYFFITLEKESSKNSELLKLKGIKEIKVEEINNAERIQCEKEYIDSIANLSFLHHSIGWWANGISEKNEHVSAHYKNLCLFYSLVKTLNKYAGTQMCIFIVCIEEIFEQLKIYCNQNHIKIISLENSIILRLKSLYENFYAIVKIVGCLIKTIIRKIYITYELRTRIKKETNNKRNLFVIRTSLDNRFLIGDGDYQDAYFGKLPEYLAHQGYKVVILANIISNDRKVIQKMQDIENILIIPEEFFLKYSDFFRAIFCIYFTKIKFIKKVSFNGLDVTIIYKRELMKGFLNANYLKNILRYFIARRFAQAVTFGTYIQTFENYAWEKMAILGIRETQPKAKILGFQHAFISRNSFKYFPGRMEKDIIPLPDRIITMGKVTKEIMEKYGSYDSDSISIGCALRQEYISNLVPFKRRNFNKIVVPLTMVSSESVLVIKFLCDSDLPKTNIQVVIRCHPAAPYESFSKGLDFIMADNFLVSNEKTVKDELSDADMVLYTWTTIAVEALKMGMPIIYIDVLKPMFVDPLFECPSLKRYVSKPDQLLPTIESIYKMEDEVFYSEQKAAQKYLKDYFKPVTDDILKSAFVQG